MGSIPRAQNDAVAAVIAERWEALLASETVRDRVQLQSPPDFDRMLPPIDSTFLTPSTIAATGRRHATQRGAVKSVEPHRELRSSAR